MSSFVVGQECFMRAAGLLAGIQDASRDHIIYDYKRGKWLEPENWMDVMDEFYQMNAESVVEQYDDKEMERGTAITSVQCKRVFNEYRRKGKMLFGSRSRCTEMIMSLRNFFSCVEYQTEKEPYYFAMMMYFSRINSYLMKYLAPEVTNGWSGLEVDENGNFINE